MQNENSANQINGFKGFDKNLKCRDMQYVIGETFEIEAGKDLKVCPDGENEAGLHFCGNPIDVFGYYPPSDSRYCEVVGSGESKTHSDDSKVASSRLYIKTEITLRNLIDAAVKFTFEKVNWESAKESNTGYQSAATNTGYQSAATNTGDRSAATNTGYQSAATNTGDRSAATNTGDRSAATVEGIESVAISIGIEGKAKGKRGCFIVLADWSQDENYDWHRKNVLSFFIDGEIIKEDIFYTLKDGIAVEAV